MTCRDNFRLVRVMLAAPSNLISVCQAPIVSIVTAVVGEELCMVCCDRVSRVQTTFRLSSQPFCEAASTLRLVLDPRLSRFNSRRLERHIHGEG